MIKALKRHLVSLDEAIEYEELSDTAYLHNYTYLVRERRLVAKTISKRSRSYAAKITRSLSLHALKPKGLSRMQTTPIFPVLKTVISLDTAVIDGFVSARRATAFSV